MKSLARFSARVRGISLPILLVAALAVAPAFADERLERIDASPPAHENGVIRFSREVTWGKSFQKKLWGDLVFVLKATDYGWDITVTSASNANANFVSVITPPYRFDNPRQVGTVYGRSAPDAVAWTPRAFSFVVTQADYAMAVAAMRKLLWPPVGSDEEFLSARMRTELQMAEMTLSQVPRANGLLKITGARTSGAASAGGTRIESLVFEVEIRQPVDPQEALREKFLDAYPEYATVEEACPGMGAAIRVGKVLYKDFDGDGFDEAVVLAFSCVAGTGGVDILGVFTRLESGRVVELAIDDAIFNSQKNHQNLRGKVDLKILGGKLVKEFPIYRDNDPNCCPTGGVRRFYYRWDGKAFAADKVEDLSAEGR